MVDDIGERRRPGYVDQYTLCERFLEYGKRKAPNDPGEPQRAAEFLREFVST